MPNDPMLNNIAQGLGKLYGDRLKRVVLFGSRARGGAQPDSDYDVAVFLDDLPDRWHEIYQLSDWGFDVMRETGRHVHAIPFEQNAYQDWTPLMHEIRREGVDLRSQEMNT